MRHYTRQKGILMGDRYEEGMNRFFGETIVNFTPGASVCSAYPLHGNQTFHDCTVTLERPTGKSGVKPHAVLRDGGGTVVLDVGARAVSLYRALLVLEGKPIRELHWSEEPSMYSDSNYLKIRILSGSPNADTPKTVERIFLDTETTGLDPDDDEILQLSIIDGDGNVLLNSKYRPERHSVWYDAQRIHQIAPSDVASCPPIAEDLARIQAILDNAQQVYAFNAPFDFAFLGALGLHLDSERGFDTMRLYARKFHRKEYIKLTVAASESRYSYHAHDALADCYATLHVQRRVDGIRPLKQPKALNVNTPTVTASPQNQARLDQMQGASSIAQQQVIPAVSRTTRVMIVAAQILFWVLTAILALFVAATFAVPAGLIFDIPLALICIMLWRWIHKKKQCSTRTGVTGGPAVPKHVSDVIK